VGPRFITRNSGTRKEDKKFYDSNFGKSTVNRSLWKYSSSDYKRYMIFQTPARQTYMLVRDTR